MYSSDPVTHGAVMTHQITAPGRAVILVIVSAVVAVAVYLQGQEMKQLQFPAAG